MSNHLSAAACAFLCTYTCLYAFPSTALAQAAHAPAVTTRPARTVLSRNGFWPPAPDEPRIQFLVAFGADGRPVTKPAGPAASPSAAPPENAVLWKPYGVRAWKGHIYVCDLRRAGVVVLDPAERQPRLLQGNDTLRMLRPCDIAIADDGCKYVADLGSSPAAQKQPGNAQPQAGGMIFAFDADDKPIATFGGKDLQPVGIAVFRDELFVCDTVTRSIKVLDRHTGDLHRIIGGPGDQQGKFVWPLGVATDPDGHLYVVDVLKCELQRFDVAGQFIGRFGAVSDRPGGFVRPKQVAVDKEDIIYIADAAFENVQLFDQQGHPLTFFGGGGTHPGAMYLPAGICISEDLQPFASYIHPAFKADRLIIVTNQFGPNLVNVYAFGRLRPGKTIKDLRTPQ